LLGHSPVLANNLPKSGFGKDCVTINPKNRAYYFAHQIVTSVLEGISHTITPNNNTFKLHLLSQFKDNQSSTSKLEKNLMEMILHGNETTKLYAQSLMCSSFPFSRCQKLYQKHSMTLCTDHFSSYWKTFLKLKEGMDVLDPTF